ncbi:MAG: hypothetical protein AAB367_00205 [Patescibacteria group bacterium]
MKRIKRGRWVRSAVSLLAALIFGVFASFASATCGDALCSPLQHHRTECVPASAGDVSVCKAWIENRGVGADFVVLLEVFYNGGETSCKVQNEGVWFDQDEIKILEFQCVLPAGKHFARLGLYGVGWCPNYAWNEVAVLDVKELACEAPPAPACSDECKAYENMTNMKAYGQCVWQKKNSSKCAALLKECKETCGYWQ